MTSTPQSTSVSTSSEIKPDLGSYQSTSAETYMLQSSTDGGPQSAQSYLHHQVPLHHAEGQIPSLPHPPSSSSTSNAPQQQQPLSMSTGHQRTASQHYMSSSTETIHTSTSSSNNGVSSHSNGNVGSSMPTSESGNGNSSSGGGQILSQFEQQSISSSQSGPSSSLGQQQQQQSCFVYVKCEPGVSQPNTVTHYSTEAAKPLPSVEQMQYEVQTQPVQQQSRLLLNDPNASGSGHQQSTGDNCKTLISWLFVIIQIIFGNLLQHCNKCNRCHLNSNSNSNSNSNCSSSSNHRQPMMTSFHLLSRHAHHLRHYRPLAQVHFRRQARNNSSRRSSRFAFPWQAMCQQ